ncbi:flagellar biosynthetic protein FliO [Roseibium sp. M-1]
MQNWIETTFNVSGGVTQAVAVILALAVVLLLFGLFIFILKRLMGANAPQNRNRQPRIAVMDSAQVDARRRLVLIRRDNIEHLILIGGPSDVVVEQHIIRNAPLTQQTMTPTRSGAQAVPPMPGHAPVKAATAPGPEIPPTPEDVAALHEPAPPAPAVQARPPAYAAPVSAPVSAAVSAPVAASAPPASSRPAAPPVSAAKPAAPTPVQAAPVRPQTAAPAITAGTAPSTSPESGGGLNRAADLLRAATQNGFNRAASRQQPVFDDRDGGTGAPGAPGADAVQAPAVRAPAPETSEQQESGTASAFKSLTRPFTARDRPSYGGSITPPASGPAARAKTALIKPVDPVQPAPKIEPVLATAAHAAGSMAAEQSELSGQLFAETAVQPEELVEPSAPETSTDAAESETAAAEAKDTQPETDAVQPLAEAIDMAEMTAGETEADTDNETASASPAADAGNQSAGASPVHREITLDLDDLLEDVPVQEVKSEAEPVPAPEPAALPEAHADEDSPEKDLSPGPETGPTAVQATPAPAVAPAAPAVRPPEPVKPVQRSGAGLGDRNPIEEEMAKILDELGGQSPR